MTRPAPIVRTLLADAPLNEGVLISIIQEARNVDAEDIRIANAILPDAGTYLNRFAIQLFIRAEMTDEEARREIARQKAFFKRLRLLLPALAGYFSFENDQDALSFLMNVSDVHQDFYAIAREKREDRNRRETLASFVTARKAMEKAIVALRSANSAAVYDYGHAYSGFVSLHQLKDRKTYPHDEPFNQLVAEMELCVNPLELTHFRAKTEDRHVYIPNNQTRTHVVENAYGICRLWGGPSFVTTPGSDFSMVCSLLFEVASGAANESLAGAISRYARSKDRQEADEYAREYEGEGTPEYRDRLLYGDNFDAAKKGAKAAIERYRQYEGMLAVPELSEGAKSVVRLLMRSAIDAAEAALNEYGPHLIFADQRSPADFAEDRRKTEEWEQRLRQLNVELGQRRRAERPST